MRAAANLSRPLPSLRFVIFAWGRSGSTPLTSPYDAHPEDVPPNEPLRRPRLAPVLYVRNRACGSQSRCFGFHVKVYQLTRFAEATSPSAFLQAFDADG